MGTTITFDTLDAVRRLRESGYEGKQAEAIVRVISDAQERLVTTENFNLHMERIEGRSTLLQWMIGINLTATLGVLWKLLH